jgi:very-short-patch-repair endonuclease
MGVKMESLVFGPNPPAPFPEGKGEEVMQGRNHDLVSRQKIAGNKLVIAKDLRHKMTPEEELLWAHLRGNKLGGYHFRRQQIVNGFIVDFYCHSAALVIELDGDIHQNQVEEDAARDQILADHGLFVLRFPNQDLYDDLSTVLQRLLSHASSPPSLQGRGPGG